MREGRICRLRDMLYGDPHKDRKPTFVIASATHVSLLPGPGNNGKLRIVHNGK